MSKVYLVHHQDIVPNEGINKYQVKVFKYFSDARGYCERNCVRVNEEGYNGMNDEDRVEYIVYDSWSPEFMWIEEVDMHESSEQEFSRLYKW